ncbi:ABC transporter permease [Chryseolinea sp. T2]|uniref:ABC transporter permease n=1 Tax=Chryseolinea sp. T2 TaxID=3129255 RepID=UPI003076C7A1
MLRNTLPVALRNLLRNKTVALIQVGGFALGLAAFLFSIKTVLFEYSFDNFHAGADQLFFVSTTVKGLKGGAEDQFVSTMPALIYRIKSSVPDVEYVSRYFDQGNREPYCIVSYTPKSGPQKSYNEPGARYVDEEFLNVFDFPLLQGDRNRALSTTTSMVMTKSLARKYFGDENPLGKVVQIRTGGTETRQTQFNYQVTGIIDDVPENSTLRFDMLLPFRNFEDNYLQDIRNIWYWPGFFTFMKTNHAVSRDSLESKVLRTVPAEANKQLADGQRLELKVQPINELHFESGRIDSNAPSIQTNPVGYTLMIGLIGMSILAVAAINYINLTTAKTFNRVKEVGVRRIMGASAWNLARQYLLDASLIHAAGFVVALIILLLARPLIIALTGKYVPFLLWTPGQVILIAFALLASVLVNGLIPLTTLAKLHSVKALRGYSVKFSDGAFMRKALVVLQFVVSVTLIIFSFTVFLQIKHLQLRERGFESDHRIQIRNIGTDDPDFTKFRAFREKVLNNKQVINVTGAMAIPGKFAELTTSEYTNLERPDERVRLCQNVVDWDYASTMGIELVAGREFTRERTTGEKVVMINETSVKAFGFQSADDAVDKPINFVWRGSEGDMTLKIIGVVRDVNNTNLPGSSVLPGILMYANTAWPYGTYNYVIVHLAPGNISQSVAALEKEWKSMFPGTPFEYTFQDIVFQRIFERDERIRSIAGLSTLLSIFIACMGLAGLMSFSLHQRVKEIGIRKVLGATISQILVLLSSDFVRLIILSIALAVPLGWIIAKQFLNSYQYRIELSYWMFVIPCIILLFIAVATISHQTIRAARGNPVDALRHE